MLVLNFKTSEMTTGCIESLERVLQTPPLVLLMDNGSGAYQERLLGEFVAQRPHCRLLLFQENLGYCAAMNRGLAAAAEAGAEYALFLNSDVTTDEDFLAPLVAVLDNDPSVAGVSPTVLLPHGKVWCQGASVGFSSNLVRLHGLGKDPAPRSAGPCAVGFLPGACVLYRLDALTAVGGIDESYFMYFEDSALGAALRAHGHTLLWLPWVRVIHHPSASSGGGRSPLRKFMMAVNSVRYLRSHFSVKLWAAWFLFDVIGLPLAYLAGGVRAGWAKTTGLARGLLGHRVTAADVVRWLDP
ncbi:MAG: glycosyltransferase family 2 protein [Planctomycetes bacterium]|nr:glycosyltransferase family 2 protein [Planctomycetota bacterium]